MQTRQLIIAVRLFLIISLVMPLAALSQRPEQGKHIVKMNIPAIFINNYSFQYEYVVSRKISLALNTRLMPASKIPFQSVFLQDVNMEDPSINNTLDRIRLSNMAITPELRYYFSKKGHGRGFYVAPFFRYAKYETENLQFEFDDVDNDSTYLISLGGELRTQTYGLLIGAQWNLGKHIILDWWILGPQFGRSRGSFMGTTDYSMDASLQQSLRQEMDKVEIPFTKKEVSVTNNSATLDLTGPWAGIRTGILLGIRF